MNLKVKVIKEDNKFYLMVKPKDQWEKNKLELLVGKETWTALRTKHAFEPLEWEILDEIREIKMKTNQLLKNWSGTLD